MMTRAQIPLPGLNALAVALVGSVFGACVGLVGSTSGAPGASSNPGTSGNSGASGTSGSSGVSGTSGASGTGDPNVLLSCGSVPTGSPLAVPLQRINDTQYNSIITELFGSTVAAQTAFPAPLSGYLYSTYSGANPMGEEQVQAALDAAESVAMQVADIVPACSSVSAETFCATSYLTTLASRAFRRAATSDEMTVILGAYTHARPTLPYGESVAVGVETVLQMPQFLYVLEAQPTAAGAAPTTLTGAELAQRMALLYWNGLPDQMLLDAASSGGLADPNNRFAQAQRMMQDPRAHGVFTDFLLQWMKVKGFHADVHTVDLQAALDEEMQRDIDHALAANDGLLDLIDSQQTFVNSVLETFYGLPAQSAGPTDWRQVDLGAQQRVGILTHPLLLAKFAHGQIGSPILRGKFIRVMAMCDDISPPPAGAQALQDTLTPMGATVREQSQARLNSPTCGFCHKLMDPIGFGFSAFDGVGNYVPTVGGQAVDVSGHIESTSDLGGDFNGVRALGDKLAQSPKVQACLAAQWMRYAFGTQETTADQCTVAALASRFGQQNNSLPALFAGLSALDSFAQRRALPEAP
jgi:Protein of unknown function (DUF1592)/Protein of unknown function (DUF1588)/Protein of unknown function (DUF1595)/Protein of unknown function (DUF1585)/Protein of unknown function (DUF1587)